MALVFIFSLGSVQPLYNECYMDLITPTSGQFNVKVKSFHGPCMLKYMLHVLGDGRNGSNYVMVTQL